MNTLRTLQRQRWATYTLAVALVVLLLVVAAGSMLAMPPDPIDPDPLPIEEPDYPVPDNGFEWRMPARYGLYENGIVDFHWIEAEAIYEPEHVNPNEFIVVLDGCRTWQEEETGTSQLTYTWTIDGQVTSGHACIIQHAFPAQATYPVTLRIIKSDGSVLLDDQGRGNPFTQSIVVKDFLIVSIGDSYGSGEGNPDRWQELGGSDIFGQPTHVESPPVWQDRRCHRSANAAPAQAARLLEMADPHSSVTFISFACSSATINTHTYDDAPIWDPYRRAPDYPLVKDRGTGILGPGCGQEPPNPDRPQDNQLPSQISQVVTALTNNGTFPARPVDALLISAGGNDMGFVPVIQLCALYWECETDVLVSSQYGGLKILQDRVTDDVNALPAKYDALAADIETYIPFSPNGRVYITQYPDPTRDSSGAHCNEALTDIIPWWVSAGVTGGTGWEALWGNAYTVPLPPHRWDQDEATWAGGTVGPALNDKIAAAAQAHDWILVDGINDSTANLFATHGYCAADNWIRTATESVDIQGPWSHWLWPAVWPAASVKTTGTMHPTTAGNWAVAQRIMAKMGPILLPSVDPVVPPAFTSTSNDAIVSSSGWLTGHAAGVVCPVGAADCTFAQVVATAAENTVLNGASLTSSGVPVACSPTGLTTDGLTCRGEQTSDRIYTWSLAFAADGVYQLGFSASSTNGGVATYSRQVKVDLTDPVASHTLSSDPNASGWYLTPVTVTVTAGDGNGSGPATLEYELDNIPAEMDGNGGAIVVDENGGHWLRYRVTDTAGRTSAWQNLPLPIDHSAPVSVVSVSPDPNADGWRSGSSAEVTISTTEFGTSGLAGLTYSATGAQDIPSTTVTDDDTVSVSITEEGETTITFFAMDIAGNVEETQTIMVRLDRGAPVISCAAPDGQWHADNVSILCTANDGGAGLANAGDASFSLTTAVPAGSETANATTDSRQVCDAAGNCATVGPVTSNRVDRKAPASTAAVNPAPSAAGWHSAASVAVTLSTTDSSGSGIESLTYSATGAQDIASTTVDGASPVQLSITTEGVTTINFAATDVAGNVEQTHSIIVRLDNSAPLGTCGDPDGQWHADNVSILCTASDSGAGLANASDASFSLTTAVAAGSETANATTDSRQVCDAAGNCTTIGSVTGNKVDRKAPSITLIVPSASAGYMLNTSILANYACTDGGSGIATCSGTVANGSAIDTASLGNKSFSVVATDSVGNTASQSVSYQVAYGLCVLFDQTKSHKLGSTVPIKLQLCDAGGSNMSAEDIVLHATGLTKMDNSASSDIVPDAGNANPDGDFRFDPVLGGYVFNLSTKGLSKGTWSLSFTITNDPTPHNVVFDLR